MIDLQPECGGRQGLDVANELFGSSLLRADEMDLLRLRVPYDAGTLDAGDLGERCLEAGYVHKRHRDTPPKVSQGRLPKGIAHLGYSSNHPKYASRCVWDGRLILWLLRQALQSPGVPRAER